MTNVEFVIFSDLSLRFYLFIIGVSIQQVKTDYMGYQPGSLKQKTGNEETGLSLVLILSFSLSKMQTYLFQLLCQQQNSSKHENTSSHLLKTLIQQQCEIYEKYCADREGLGCQ